MNILDLKRKLMSLSGYMSGGGSPASSSGTSTTGLPEWAKGYAQDTLAKQSALSERPYEAYNAPRIQGFTPMQEQARQNAANMTTSPLSAQAGSIAGDIANRAQGTSYTPGQFNAQQVGAPGLQDYQMGPAQQVSASQLQNYQMGPAERVGTQSFTGQGTADQYMNPYMQSVVDIQKREAGRQSGIQGTQQQAQATQAGAFGGSRDAIMRAERERNLGQQMGDIQAQGSNAAFQQAQQQFNAEQNARLAAQQANQQAGLTTGIQNLAANLGVQQLGSGQNMQAQLANQQAGLTTGSQNLAARLGTQQFGAGQNLQSQLANQAAGLTSQQQGEQSRQFGAGLGMQGLQTGLSAAGQLGTLGGQQFQQGMDINQLRSAYGAQEQAMGQQGLSQAYQDYQNQREYPQQQLSNMASMMRGMPIGSTSTYTGTQNPGSPSFGQQLASLGAGAYGLKQFFADGGSVDSQQNIESIVSKLSDQQLAQAEEAAKARGDQEQLQIIGMEKAARASMQRGLGAMPVDMDKMLPTEQSMARGGIVAFARGGMDSDFGLGYGEGTAAPAGGGGYADVEKLEPELDEEGMRKGLLRSLYKQYQTPAPAYTEQTPEQRLAAVMAARKSISDAAGPSQYGEERENIKRMRDENATNLKQGKGLAALQAAAAMLQGNDLSRGLAAGAGAFGKAYGDTARTAQTEERALQNMRINLADAERKEKMGLHRDAEASVAAAEKYRRDAHLARQDEINRQRTLQQGILAATKPEKPAAETKLPEQLAAAEIAAANSPDDPAIQRTVKALRAAVGQTRTSFGTNVSEAGPGKREDTAAGLEQAAQLKRETEVAAATKAVANEMLVDGEARKLKKRDPAAYEAEKKRRIEERLQTGSALAKSLATPRAGTPPPVTGAPDISTVTGAPKGSRIGKLVAGKGHEVLDSSGKLLGYAQ